MFKETIGKGSFGSVFKGNYLGVDVAIKKIEKADDPEYLKYIDREVSMLQYVSPAFLLSPRALVLALVLLFALPLLMVADALLQEHTTSFHSAVLGYVVDGQMRVGFLMYTLQGYVYTPQDCTSSPSLCQGEM